MKKLLGLLLSLQAHCPLYLCHYNRITLLLSIVLFAYWRIRPRSVSRRPTVLVANAFMRAPQVVFGASKNARRCHKVVFINIRFFLIFFFPLKKKNCFLRMYVLLYCIHFSLSPCTTRLAAAAAAVRGVPIVPQYADDRTRWLMRERNNVLKKKKNARNKLRRALRRGSARARDVVAWVSRRPISRAATGPEWNANELLAPCGFVRLFIFLIKFRYKYFYFFF